MQFLPRNNGGMDSLFFAAVNDIFVFQFTTIDIDQLPIQIHIPSSQYVLTCRSALKPLIKSTQRHHSFPRIHACLVSNGFHQSKNDSMFQNSGKRGKSEPFDLLKIIALLFGKASGATQFWDQRNGFVFSTTPLSIR